MANRTWDPYPTEFPWGYTFRTTDEADEDMWGRLNDKDLQPQGIV